MNLNIYLDNNAKIKVIVLDTQNLFSDSADFKDRKVLSNRLLSKQYWINKDS